LVREGEDIKKRGFASLKHLFPAPEVRNGRFGFGEGYQDDEKGYHLT